MNEQREDRCCIYCGAPIRAGRTCSAHRELEELDPHGQPARRPLTEGQAGVRPWYRIGRRSYRRELY